MDDREKINWIVNHSQSISVPLSCSCPRLTFYYNAWYLCIYRTSISKLSSMLPSCSFCYFDVFPAMLLIFLSKIVFTYLDVLQFIDFFLNDGELYHYATSIFLFLNAEYYQLKQGVAYNELFCSGKIISDLSPFE